MMQPTTKEVVEKLIEPWQVTARMEGRGHQARQGAFP